MGAIRFVGRIPRVGDPLQKLIEAVRMYRRRPRVLLLSSIMSVGVHSLFAVGLYLIAVGLFRHHLSLGEHFVVVPVSNVASVIPLPMGPFEAVLDFLYASAHVAGVVSGQGLVVALAYRLITGLIAALGVFYYFGNRREMAEVMHEAEDEEAVTGLAERPESSKSPTAGGTP